MQFGFSAHGIKSGRLEGVLGSIMQLFDSPALSGGIRMTCCKIVSCWLILSFSASLYCWHFPHVLNLFFSCIYFSALTFSLMFKYRSPGSWTSKRGTIGYQEHHYLPSPCESLSDQWDLYQRENNPSVRQMLPYGHRVSHILVEMKASPLIKET